MSNNLISKFLEAVRLDSNDDNSNGDFLISDEKFKQVMEKVVKLLPGEGNFNFYYRVSPQNIQFQ